MKMCKKGIAWILALMLVLSMAPSVFAAEGDESGETATEAFDISKSKEATQLEKTGDKFESTVTLSLPSAEKQLVTDVVFVLDKSTSAEMEQQDLDMMFMMMTNIVDTSTELLCCGLHADLLAKEAFDIADGDEHIILKDIVSRKKQFLPAFVEALHQ